MHIPRDLWQRLSLHFRRAEGECKFVPSVSAAAAGEAEAAAARVAELALEAGRLQQLVDKLEEDLLAAEAAAAAGGTSSSMPPVDNETDGALGFTSSYDRGLSFAEIRPYRPCNGCQDNEISLLLCKPSKPEDVIVDKGALAECREWSQALLSKVYAQ